MLKLLKAHIGEENVKVNTANGAISIKRGNALLHPGLVPPPVLVGPDKFEEDPQALQEYDQLMDQLYALEEAENVT
jgi:hypothetical protein